MERMLLLGHSFVHCLDAFMKGTERVNFEFDECRTTCRLIGIGGLRIDGLFSPRMMDEVATFRPGLLMIEIGTNDIDASCVIHGALKMYNNNNNVLHLTTYASGFAFCAVFGNEWLQGRFPVNWSAVHVSVKELLPIILAVHSWGSTFKNRRILFLSYTSAMVDVINKQTTRYVSLMDLIRELVVLCMSHNICFRTKYIPNTNVVADHISWLQEVRARVVQPTLAPDKVPLRTHWLPWGKHQWPIFVNIGPIPQALEQGIAATGVIFMCVVCCFRAARLVVRPGADCEAGGAWSSCS